MLTFRVHAIAVAALAALGFGLPAGTAAEGPPGFVVNTIAAPVGADAMSPQLTATGAVDGRNCEDPMMPMRHRALEAIDARDADRLCTAGAGLDNACSNCQAKYVDVIVGAETN